MENLAFFAPVKNPLQLAEINSKVLALQKEMNDKLDQLLAQKV